MSDYPTTAAARVPLIDMFRRPKPPTATQETSVIRRIAATYRPATLTIPAQPAAPMESPAMTAGKGTRLTIVPTVNVLPLRNTRHTCDTTDCTGPATINAPGPGGPHRYCGGCAPIGGGEERYKTLSKPRLI